MALFYPGPAQVVFIGGAWLTAMEPRIRLTEAAQALRQSVMFIHVISLHYSCKMLSNMMYNG